MNWIQFAIWLTSIYLGYYLIVILLDTRKNSRSAANDKDVQILSFPTEPVTQKVEYPPRIITPAEPISKASGGVLLKGLFELARQESIHFSTGVKF